MRNSIHNSLLQTLIQNRNGYLALASGSLVLNILLTTLLFCSLNREKIIMVPPVINKSFWVEASHVSPAYLSEMSLFFIDLRFNNSPGSVDFQRETLLRYVSPESYENLKTMLAQEGEELIKNHITTVFYPVDVKVDTKQLLAKITGDLVSSIGTALLPAKRMTYLIHYHYHDGRLLVQSFEESHEK